MRFTHLGHSTVLVETSGARVLIDPGNFSHAWHDLTDLDVICVTHLHPDHIDPEYVPGLIAANPGARVLVEPGVAHTYDLDRAETISAETTMSAGGLSIAAVGGLHAVIHRDIPQIGNVGLVLSSEGEPTFFHPGDSLAAIPAGVDVVGVPAYGPWAAMKETVDFVRQVGAGQGFCIHEGLLNERGWTLAFTRINELTDTRLVDLRGATPWTPRS